MTSTNKISVIVAFLLFGGSACGGLINSVLELDGFLNGRTRPRTAFCVTGTVVRHTDKGIILEESDTRVHFPHTPQPFPDIGVRVRLRGTAAVLPSGEPTIYGDQSFEVIGRGTVPETATVDLEHIDERRMNLRQITTQGRLIGYLTDEIDPAYTILLIRQGRSTYPVFIETTPDTPDVGAILRVTGTFNSKGSGGRKFARPFISASIAQVKTIKPAPDDPFDAPRIETQLYLTPEEVGRLGRRSALGQVLTAWDGNKLLIRSDANRIVNVSLLPGQPLPEPGTVVTVVGQPETDLYQLNLAFGLWRAEHNVTLPPDPAPEECTISRLFQNERKQQIINYSYNGRLIRLSGWVRDLVKSDGHVLTLRLGKDGHDISVDCKAARIPSGSIEVGAKVVVTGYCRMETASSGQNFYFPSAHNQSVVLRSDDDVAVLESPPWWTPGRLLFVFLLMLAVLTAVFLWNLSLHILVKRRNHQLFKTQLDKASSELRVDERTRLAVELHDSLAQNLDSVSMEVTTALCMDKDHPSEMIRHLTIAAKGLKACCLDLRNTLWDLRSEALEEPVIDRAIRKTLLPHLKGVTLSLRFNVPRNKFSDKTLHEILCIIRELSINAIRHGKATEIKIAGALDSNALRFSVSDNGCGFDSSAVPGIEEGHYGLVGIHDRLRRLGGTLVFERPPEGGTKAIVSL